MKVLVACECSGVVRRVFRALGHEAWSCDYQESEDNSEFHYRGDVHDLLDINWDLMIAHPPCTHLSASGARHWEAKREMEKHGLYLQEWALNFVKELMNAPIPKIAIENPVGKIGTAIRKPDQIIHPWMFGFAETKATCLWLKNLPKLVPTEIVEPIFVTDKEREVRRTAKGSRMSVTHAKYKSGKERARTYLGIAVAMGLQWGGRVDE